MNAQRYLLCTLKTEVAPLRRQYNPFAPVIEVAGNTGTKSAGAGSQPPQEASCWVARNIHLLGKPIYRTLPAISGDVRKSFLSGGKGCLACATR